MRRWLRKISGQVKYWSLLSTVTDNHNSSVDVLVGHNPVSVISAQPKQAKRKLGRPRKETASQPPPVKKPRGRPRKDPSSLPSRGRGWGSWKVNNCSQPDSVGRVQGGTPTVSCSVQTGGGGGGREYCRLKDVILYFTIVTNFNIVNKWLAKWFGIQIR